MTLTRNLLCLSCLTINSKDIYSEKSDSFRMMLNNRLILLLFLVHRLESEECEDLDNNCRVTKDKNKKLILSNILRNRNVIPKGTCAIWKSIASSLVAIVHQMTTALRKITLIKYIA